MKNITITNLESNQRIDKYVRKYLNEAPLSFIYSLFRKKDIKVNGHWVKENYIIQENDVVSIYVTDSQLEEFNLLSQKSEIFSLYKRSKNKYLLRSCLFFFT